MFTNTSRPSVVDVQMPFAVGDIFAADSTSTVVKIPDVAIGNVLLSGGVGAVPAWGKITLTSHVTGVLPAINGGTGVANTGTITNASNLTVTGGGTIALGGFTLTIPATGTAGLLGTANLWTAANRITTAAAGFIVRNSNSASYSDIRIYNDQDSGSRTLELAYTGSAYAGAFLAGTNAPTGEQAVVVSAGAFPLVFGTNNTYRAQIDSGGTFWVDNATLAAVFRQSSTTGYVSQRWYNDQNSGSRALEQGYTGSADASAVLTSGIVGESGYVATTGNQPLQIGTNNTARLTFTGAGIGNFINSTDASAIGTAAVTLVGGVSVAKRSYLGTIGSSFSGNVLAGVQNATAAAAGQVGEVLSSTVSGVAVATSGNVGNVTSVSITPGDWLISGQVVITGGATGLTSGSTAKMSMVTTTATNGTSGDTMTQESVLALLANGLFEMAIPQIRVNISATTTYYMTEEVTYVAGSPTVAGRLTATRIR